MLGSGPNRIGQGVEFDYCCVRAAQTFRRLGYEAVMLNSNPETVSTDYDTSDRLYLEPVTLERVLDVVRLEQPKGVVVSLGGQTPLRLARALEDAGVPLLGDPLPAIEAAEDRGAFAAPAGGDRPARAALGHRRDDGRGARRSPGRSAAPSSCARTTCSAAAGCASSTTPTRSRSPSPCSSTSTWSRRSSSTSTSSATARRLGRGDPRARRAGRCPFGRLGLPLPGPSVHAGARRGDPRARAARSSRGSGRAGCSTSSSRCSRRGDLYVIEANPRASRTVPFVAKATGIPLVDHACRLMLGERLAELDLPERAEPTRVWAKEAIFPATASPNAADRGPEMKSTGEVMAGGDTAFEAYRRVLRAAGRAQAAGRSARRCRRSRGGASRFPRCRARARRHPRSDPPKALVVAAAHDALGER